MRSDYASAAYARLGAEAMRGWRGWESEKGPEGEGVYVESGLCLVADGEEDGGGRGWGYVKASLENVRAQGWEDPLEGRGPSVGGGGEVVRVLRSRREVEVAAKMGEGGGSGGGGYVNWGSGWVDARRAVADVGRRVRELGKERVGWRKGLVRRLQVSDASGAKRRVTGVELEDGSSVEADLVVLATGAWTGKLVDLRGRAEATAQVLAYVQLSEDERIALKDMPVLLNLSTGMFVIPPTGDGVLKVARHGYGYRNPVRIPHPEKVGVGEEIEVSLPADDFETLPAEGAKACRDTLMETLPWLGERAFCRTRLCWYTDTPTGDFLVDWHPGYEGLFLATGGSGHAFKFLPVLGEKIVDAVEGGLEKDLAGLWAWPRRGVEGFTGTEDGSRGGRRGMILREEMQMSREVKSRL